MSKQYIYSDGEQAVIISDGSIIWNQPQDETLPYFDANNPLVTDSSLNETYSTAIDSTENTQYFSILDDSAELTLEDLSNLNLTLGPEEVAVPPNNNSEVENKDEEVTNVENNAEVVVFMLEGSKDLYGIQSTEDESGQIQRYQFTFRQTPGGQLEPIPETVVLLPNEDQASEEVVPQEALLNPEQYYLVPASLEHDKASFETSEEQYVKVQRVANGVEENNSLLNEVEENVVAEASQFDLRSAIDVKQEHLESIIDKENVQSQEISQETLHITNSREENYEVSENKPETLLGNFESEEHFYDHLISENNQIEVEYETELVTSGTNEEGIDNEAITENLRDTLEPLAGETQPVVVNNINPDQTPQDLVTHQTNPLRGDKSRKSLDNVKYLVVYHEKENVDALSGAHLANSRVPTSKTLKPQSNSRSVLRTSFIKDPDKIENSIGDKALPEDDVYHKRFAKNKDALLAKKFHNFLNRTTIPQAPVRKHRQPRKQLIKPIIERSKEEIIVQEVIVSSGGFVESGNKRIENGKLLVTAVVELSDSEEDTNPNRILNKKHLTKNQISDKVIEITSDSEDTVVSGTDLQSNCSDKSLKRKSIHNLPTGTVKRKRGRPPRKALVTQEKSSVPDSTSSDLIKKEVICPYCPKTFPSQNSLNTHINHHKLNNLQNKAKMNMPRQSLLRKLEYSHKCEKCEQTFKNNILLQKHECAKNTSHSCPVCLQQFRNITLFNMHKKSHVKSNLIYNTSVLKVSPRKATVTKSPLKSNCFKCSECPRVCDSETKLAVHVKTHKKIICSSCSATFTSKVLLDSHVRTNCVKNKRLAFTIQKNLAKPSPAIANTNKSLNRSVLGVKIECEQCPMKFSTFRSLYTHKVQNHGMSTPDKNLLVKPKKKIYKERGAHGGVPASQRLQKAFAAMKQKIIESGSLTVQ
ncbi:uncharacterized protein [Euwallacea similis]|uniref:uncharacterized protein n=1 Tax=Euwallacea similis TaxID=1736056 RepID=UPI00344E8E51